MENSLKDLFDTNREAYVLAIKAGTALRDGWPERFALERQAREAGATQQHIQAAWARAGRGSR
jgi:hypothetical protein